uniref:Thiamin biosynthesis protein S n=1 Tax=Nemalion vermiculare TaxID=935621 RepID=UPI00257AF43B|nr:Thiamin biosynthesis protein S [Nemalion vermiculare]WGV34466.1 Thiamin biosynthesis protein S [Nemalion vermiculare]
MLEQYFIIQINGEPFHCFENLSIYSLLEYLNIDIDINLVEYNNEILHEHQFKLTFVQESDKLEIITIVGGG